MKSDLRKSMSERRAALEQEQAKAMNEIIYSRLHAHHALERAEDILVYLSFRSEIETRPLIDQWLKEKRRVYVPVMQPESRSILPVQIDEDHWNLPVNAYGIQEPKLEGAAILPVEKLDLVIVPGLAFDIQGFRLGYGGGYYDRLIPRLRNDAYTLALCYDFQLVESVPVGPFDQKVQTILTELREENQ